MHQNRPISLFPTPFDHFALSRRTHMMGYTETLSYTTLKEISLRHFWCALWIRGSDLLWNPACSSFFIHLHVRLGYMWDLDTCETWIHLQFHVRLGSPSETLIQTPNPSSSIRPPGSTWYTLPVSDARYLTNTLITWYTVNGSRCTWVKYTVQWYWSLY